MSVQTDFALVSAVGGDDTPLSQRAGERSGVPSAITCRLTDFFLVSVVGGDVDSTFSSFKTAAYTGKSMWLAAMTSPSLCYPTIPLSSRVGQDRLCTRQRRWRR